MSNHLTFRDDRICVTCGESFIQDGKTIRCIDCHFLYKTGQFKGLKKSLNELYLMMCWSLIEPPSAPRKYSWLKLRFLVLERDNFTCKYCGRKAPNVELHVDHIQPKSIGGLDELTNLVAACRDCNFGKSDVLLGQRQKEDLLNSIN